MSRSVASEGAGCSPRSLRSARERHRAGAFRELPGAAKWERAAELHCLATGYEPAPSTESVPAVKRSRPWRAGSPWLPHGRRRHWPLARNRGGPVPVPTMKRAGRKARGPHRRDEVVEDVHSALANTADVPRSPAATRGLPRVHAHPPAHEAGLEPATAPVRSRVLSQLSYTCKGATPWTLRSTGGEDLLRRKATVWRQLRKRDARAVEGPDERSDAVRLLGERDAVAHRVEHADHLSLASAHSAREIGHGIHARHQDNRRRFAHACIRRPTASGCQ